MPVRSDDPDSWKKEAACRQMGPALFFPSGASEDTAFARMVCRGCPVRIECLTFALATPNTDGIWADTNRRERERIRRRRRKLMESTR